MVKGIDDRDRTHDDTKERREIEKIAKKYLGKSTLTKCASKCFMNQKN